MMTNQLSSTTNTANLYERDYYLWLSHTAQLIKEVDILTRLTLTLKDGDSGIEQHSLLLAVLRCLTQEKMPLLYKY